MTATADKARYFLEQSVPELKEYERKKIFSAEEITSIAKRRSDFEHKINARGSSPSDYVQYAEFETSVEALRRKRVKRLGIKSTTHNGQRRIFFVLDRGNRKFPGDVGLWVQNVQYCRQQKAYKKLTQTITSALRLHPTKADLWIYAASCAAEDKGDINEARSCMQRALRFVKRSRSLWIEYARLELAYISKFHARRQVLGIAEHDKDTPVERADEDEDENVIHLPKLTAEDINPEHSHAYEVDEAALKKLDQTPVMTGAIPIAIFEAAMKNFQGDMAFAHEFFEMVSDFGNVPAAVKVLQHVLDAMKQMSPRSWQLFACKTSAPLVQVPTSSPQYPAALRISLQNAAEGMAVCTDKTLLSSWYQKWLENLLKEELDPALETVLKAKLISLGR